MLQCILHNRLQQQFRHNISFHLRVNVPDHLKIIVMHHQLDIQIRLNILNTVIHSYHILPLTQSSPVEHR